jgi:putative ATP-dependent endonuclease of OLD family
MVANIMHISELRIGNFRNFMKARFCFEPGVNTLIGENGSGKTNVFHAIRLLLDESLERNAVRAPCCGEVCVGLGADLTVDFDQHLLRS